MREIKFRAWHTKQKKMFTAERLGHDQMTLSADGRGFINVGRTLEQSDFYEHMIPMQYTGLKDKNGKEIYEGDIIKVDLWDSVGLIEDIRTLFVTNSALFDSHTYKTDDFKENMEGDCEIVGNIHQDKHLLEEK